MILTPVAKRLAVKLSLTVFTTHVCCALISNPDLPHARQTLYLYTTAIVENNIHIVNIVFILSLIHI